ncbi:MAG: LPS assembly lipoprotein LptE [Candidatus Cloacimonadota bacterium]|nr:LPS assembly lipoprotein LptE [Candidatus Cloacimonadota bacterium]
MKKLLLIPLIGIILYLPECGHYSFYTRANPHLKTVMISEFENNSEQYDLPELITTYLTEKFIADNRLKVMADGADMDVNGSVLSYDKAVFSYDIQEEPTEWQITIHFSIEVKDMTKNSTIWQNKNLSLSAIYGNPENIPENESGTENLTEEDACREIIYDLCDIILGNSVEQW